MIENTIIEWISNQGFAIAVAVYLLYERSKMNTKIVASLERISTIIYRIDRKID